MMLLASDDVSSISKDGECEVQQLSKLHRNRIEIALKLHEISI